MIEPSYFGQSGHHLLGLYHPPEGARARDEGVLLCPPGPEEYMQAHWALRKLAALLARTGLHVFRFDYFGTGDSAGRSDEGRIAIWRRNASDALGELADISGAIRLSAVGFRLGATIAATARLEIHRLVLWEPVIEGRVHLAELRGVHQRRFLHCLTPPPLDYEGREGELLGQPFPQELRRELLALDLAEDWACRTRTVDIVVSEGTPSTSALAARLAATFPTVRTEVHTIDEASQASGDEPFLMSTSAQRTIATLISGANK